MANKTKATLPCSLKGFVDLARSNARFSHCPSIPTRLLPSKALECRFKFISGNNMAPNADKSSLRQRFANDDADLNNDPATQPTTLLKNIKSTEVVIDGTIYDLTSFKHPGGDSVMLFGGNDVSVQYKMIHPYHTSKHLEKMTAVGKVSDGDTE